MIRPSNLHWLPNADPSSSHASNGNFTLPSNGSALWPRVLQDSPTAELIRKARKRKKYGEQHRDTTFRNKQSIGLFVTMFAFATVNIVCISDTKSANTSSVGQQHSYPGFWLSWNYVDFKGVVTVTSFRPRARLLRSSGGRSDCCTWLGATWPPLH